MAAAQSSLIEYTRRITICCDVWTHRKTGQGEGQGHSQGQGQGQGQGQEQVKGNVEGEGLEASC